MTPYTTKERFLTLEMLSEYAKSHLAYNPIVQNHVYPEVGNFYYGNSKAIN